MQIDYDDVVPRLIEMQGREAVGTTFTSKGGHVSRTPAGACFADVMARVDKCFLDLTKADRVELIGLLRALADTRERDVEKMLPTALAQRAADRVAHADEINRSLSERARLGMGPKSRS